jgi:deoxyribonucleoside regulator
MRRNTMDLAKRERLTKIAKLYYEDGLVYQKIAEKMGMSTALVSKLLKKAREEGIVEIRVHDSRLDGNLSTLERELKEKFQLRHVNVASSSKVPEALFKASSEYLYENLERENSLGITWGTTVLGTVSQIRTMKPKDVRVRCVQLCGNLEMVPIEQNGINMVEKMCSVFNGQAYLLSVPARVDSPYIRDAILKDTKVVRVFQQYKKLDFSISSVGSLTDINYSTLHKIGYLDNNVVSLLLAKGAVGDLALHFYTIEGEIIPTDFEDTVIGIDIASYQSIPNKVVVAYGKPKVKAMYGAVKAGLIDILFTDRSSAEDLLKMNY